MKGPKEKQSLERKENPRELHGRRKGDRVRVGRAGEKAYDGDAFRGSTYEEGEEP